MYIDEDRRPDLDPACDEIASEIENGDELTYAFSAIALRCLGKSENNRAARQDIVASFEYAKLEFYRRWVVPFEEREMMENGDIDPGGLNTYDPEEDE